MKTHSLNTAIMPTIIVILFSLLLACQTNSDAKHGDLDADGQNPDSPVMEGSQEDIAAVLQVFADWGAARDAGDVEGVLAVHDPDMLIMTRDQAILRGHEGVRAFYAQNYYEGSTREMLNQVDELRVIGDVAIVIGRFLVIDEPKIIEAPGYYLIMLRRNQAGDWKIYRDIDTPSPDGLLLK